MDDSATLTPPAALPPAEAPDGKAQLATLDIVLLCVILLSALIGLARGLVKEILSLAIWATAFLLALYLASPVGERLAPDLGGASALAGFGTVFIAVLIAGALVQWVFAKLIETTGLTGTDRFLGFLFGGARGLLVCAVAAIALQPFLGSSDWWQASWLGPELAGLEERLLGFMGQAQDIAAGPVVESVAPESLDAVAEFHSSGEEER